VDKGINFGSFMLRSFYKQTNIIRKTANLKVNPTSLDVKVFSTFGFDGWLLRLHPII